MHAKCRLYSLYNRFIFYALRRFISCAPPALRTSHYAFGGVGSCKLHEKCLTKLVIACTILKLIIFSKFIRALQRSEMTITA